MSTCNITANTIGSWTTGKSMNIIVYNMAVFNAYFYTVLKHQFTLYISFVFIGDWLYTAEVSSGICLSAYL